MRTKNKKTTPVNKSGTGSQKVYFDGSGCKPDGKGSGFAWISIPGERHIERKDGLTNNQAEYRGFISALTALSDNASAEMFSDSQVVCCQFNGLYKVGNSTLAELLSAARSIVEQRKLKITLTWVPRDRNLAGRLL